jgi:hypothetical protein
MPEGRRIGKMKIIILIFSIALAGCSRQHRFEVLSQATTESAAVVYDSETRHVFRIFPNMHPLKDVGEIKPGEAEQ